MTMTLEQRVEAAARALVGNLAFADGPGAAEAIRAAFPELFTDPPSAWLAPWECPFTLSVNGQPLQDISPLWDLFRDATVKPSHISQPKGTRSEP